MFNVAEQELREGQLLLSLSLLSTLMQAYVKQTFNIGFTPHFSMSVSYEQIPSGIIESQNITGSLLRFQTLSLPPPPLFPYILVRVVKRYKRKIKTSLCPSGAFNLIGETRLRHKIQLENNKKEQEHSNVLSIMFYASVCFRIPFLLY